MGCSLQAVSLDLNGYSESLVLVAPLATTQYWAGDVDYDPGSIAKDMAYWREAGNFLFMWTTFKDDPLTGEMPV